METFELRFVSIANPGRALAFPCDAKGEVDFDTLSIQARRNYYKAWETQGKEYLSPVILTH